MLKMLQLNGKAGNPEVDCGVLIQIIRLVYNYIFNFFVISFIKV